MAGENGNIPDAARALHRAGRLEAARARYVAHLAAHPDDAGIWSNLGALLRTQGRHQLARRAQDRAHALAPHDPVICNNRANILSDLGDYDASIRLRQAVLEQHPSRVMHHAMIGRCLRGKGDYQAAIDYLAPKVLQYPQNHEIELQLAFAQLGAGQYGPGFRSYRARWRSPEMTPKTLDLPKWRDGDPIAGKRLLVLPEQGFGDAILFARFVPVLAQMGVRMHVLAESPVARLLADLDGADWVGTATRGDARFDNWMPLMDMPMAAFGSADRGAPPPPARLTVPSDSRDRAGRIAAPYRDRFKVGVVWSGSATYKGNVFRSFSHRAFLPMADIPGVQLFSLYKGSRLQDLHSDGSSAFILDAAGTDRDFADCAAMMQEMDLVITSDTATAHIAGSLGLPTWVILHWDPFWVYTHAGETTPWYPSMRLFRQDRPLDWDGVFAKVEKALRKRVTGG
ncbi:tetratricopeptide repeat-containing glycosyltransferase family protein [Salibaculum sp.]|uniref:tetratricopeptide repeat-containing glycosyltransferase family protein n=1 Tax=Salibaculum sp. TaxID=2855480 RepID=UPI002B49AA67|nr:tetratricopeptide repeat-containing glycosyltransferase family protein [Salibaculum sp.]HKL68137.1 tetratricopeptide repeat-containing glycosyltransferase family protein [Salibaculum sp.]